MISFNAVIEQVLSNERGQSKGAHHFIEEGRAVLTVVGRMFERGQSLD
jgi:hypothetical protein